MDKPAKVMQIRCASEHLLCKLFDEIERETTSLSRECASLLVPDVAHMSLEEGQEVGAEDFEYEAGMVEARRPLGRMVKFINQADDVVLGAAMPHSFFEDMCLGGSGLSRLSVRATNFYGNMTLGPGEKRGGTGLKFAYDRCTS